MENYANMIFLFINEIIPQEDENTIKKETDS